MKLIYILLFIITSTIITYGQAQIIKDGDSYYFADRIVIKYKSLSNGLNKFNDGFLQKISTTNSKPTFGTSKDTTPEAEELKKIYTVNFSSPYNPIFVAKEIAKNENIEWAEPHYIYKLAYDPNDPVYNFTGSDTLNYEHLEVIKANEAWDIDKGSEDVIIAIVDTGVEWEHSDLGDNIWINSGEIPNNGIDDDGNGFVDDIRGWDFAGLDGTPDNDPRKDRADHGTHVAGLASAVTDNGIGIASIGFKSKIMAVKTAQDDIRDGTTALIAYGYEGIKYAADNGADVINCSWGGYSYSFASQSIINYAISKGALVVAAAGNNNRSSNFYPASYDGVLSVGGTSFVDQKASWSNYGTKIDVCAPGVRIYSTWFNNSYAIKHGTSLSSPIAAGLAALTSSKFPEYNPLQIGEQIRANADNIDQSNLQFSNQLGNGRINAVSTLTNGNSKAVRITNFEFIEVGDKDGIFESNENVKIKLELTNYLQPISNLNIQLSSTDPNIEILNSGGTVGPLETLDKTETNLSFLELAIKENAAENVDVNILVSYNDLNYDDFEWITLSINPTYQIQSTENLSITFNSSGSIGFDNYPDNSKGNGLIYKDGPNLMFEGALVYGNSAGSIVNTARDIEAEKDNDFSVLIPITQNIPGMFSDKETYAKFNDTGASPKSLGIETEVYTYSFSDEINADYMYIRYVFNNTTDQSISDFYAGQYWDFDLDGSSSSDDMVAYDFEDDFGYVYDDDGNPVNTYVGLSLLSSENRGFIAMDIEGTNDSIISYDGYSDIEKWNSFNSGLNYPTAGPSDISLLISGGPFTIESDNKLEVDFVVAAGDNFSDLKSNIVQAKANYLTLPTDVRENEFVINDYKLEQNYPNPFNPSTKIKYSIPNSKTNLLNLNVKLSVYNILGEEIAVLVNEIKTPGHYEVSFDGSHFSSGVYFYNLEAGDVKISKKMLLLK